MVTKRPVLSKKVEFFKKDKKVFATVDKNSYFEVPEAALAVMGLVDGHRTVSQIARDLAGSRQKAKDVEGTISPAIEKMEKIGIIKLI